MIVTVVAMPQGTIVRTDLAEARRRLAATRYLLVDVELPETGTGPDAGAEGEQLARRLGLGDADLDWFGRPGEPARADFLGDTVGLVVPVVQDERVIHAHAVAGDRYLVTAHRGPAFLAPEITAHVRRERPRDAVALLFLVLQSALATFRRAAVAALLEVEELEDDMFQQRRPEQVYRLSRLRRRSALLHHSLLPYLQAVDEVITRRMMSPDFPVERQRLAREFQHVARMVLTDIETLQEATRRAFGSYSSLVAGEQNNVINRLAIVSVIFLPLSFLTGFFGMNFAFLTDELESRAVFWLLAIGLQVCVLGGAFYVLHRTRIWRRLRDED
ncbi:MULTISPECIES: CorA family divalent cation transporter [Streptomyces]|uniref:magnesium transporter CorA family protein n=1 Tax=Streptomyces TaxID=1883 RepID=UPI001F503412|nr:MULTISPECIES: CorA family divalent cation transporter [Streptomyces]